MSFRRGVSTEGLPLTKAGNDGTVADVDCAVC